MTGPGKAELNAMVEEATTDCYGEEEQLTGFACVVQENLEVLPLPGPPPKGAEWIAACRHWAR